MGKDPGNFSWQKIMKPLPNSMDMLEGITIGSQRQFFRQESIMCMIYNDNWGSKEGWVKEGEPGYREISLKVILTVQLSSIQNPSKATL